MNHHNINIISNGVSVTLRMPLPDDPDRAAAVKAYYEDPNNLRRSTMIMPLIQPERAVDYLVACVEQAERESIGMLEAMNSNDVPTVINWMVGMLERCNRDILDYLDTRFVERYRAFSAGLLEDLRQNPTLEGIMALELNLEPRFYGMFPEADPDWSVTTN